MLWILHQRNKSTRNFWTNIVNIYLNINPNFLGENLGIRLWIMKLTLKDDMQKNKETNKHYWKKKFWKKRLKFLYDYFMYNILKFWWTLIGQVIFNKSAKTTTKWDSGHCCLHVFDFLQCFDELWSRYYVFLLSVVVWC